MMRFITSRRKFSEASASVARGSKRAFTLVEVVVAVGIFAIAIVGVIGLLAPTSKNITDVADSDAAARVITSIQAGLQNAGYSQVLAVVQSSGSTMFYGTRDGRIGTAANLLDGSSWASDSDKFFEFTLARNEDLSPAENDSTAGFLAFTILLKWPAYAPGPDGTAVAVDDSQKSVMVVPAAITR